MGERAPTWAQAVADGVLVDITAEARRAGIVCKVALTRAAWAECIMATFAEYRAGLWPLSRTRAMLTDIRAAMQRAGEGVYAVKFWHAVERVDGIGVRELELIASPGDEGEFVLTVALVNE